MRAGEEGGVPGGQWVLRLICCGHDDGRWRCATWEEADAIRNSYVSVKGHDRNAILTKREEVQG